MRKIWPTGRFSYLLLVYNSLYTHEHSSCVGLLSLIISYIVKCRVRGRLESRRVSPVWRKLVLSRTRLRHRQRSHNTFCLVLSGCRAEWGLRGIKSKVISSVFHYLHSAATFGLGDGMLLCMKTQIDYR